MLKIVSLLALSLLLWPAAPICDARDVMECWAGKVRGKPQKVGEFSVRVELDPKTISYIFPTPVCQAVVISPGGETVFSSDDEGMDLVQPVGQPITNDGIPGVVFEGYDGGAHCCWTYHVVSLGKPPGLVLQIKNERGARFFKDKDGRFAIETGDGAFDYFDFLSHAETPFPLVFLRFEGARLIDAGAEFWPEYEKDIAEAKIRLDPSTLKNFHELRTVDELYSGWARDMAPTVLRIVFDYLYGGRPKQAWEELKKMWPSCDEARMRNLILKKRSEGVLWYTGQTATGEDISKSP